MSFDRDVKMALPVISWNLRVRANIAPALPRLPINILLHCFPLPSSFKMYSSDCYPSPAISLPILLFILWWPKIQTFRFKKKDFFFPPHLRGNEYCTKSSVWRLGFVNTLSVYLIFIKQSSLKWGGLVLVVNAWVNLWNAPKFLFSLAAAPAKKKEKMQSGCGDDWIQFVWTKKDW